MKKFFILGAIFLGLSSSLVNAMPQDLTRNHTKIDTSDLSFDKIVNLNDLTEKNQSDLLVGKFQNIIVECTAGNRLPIRFSVEGDYFSSDQSEQNTIFLNIHQTFYLTCFDEELMVSDNLNDWHYFDDFFASEDSLLISDNGNGTQFTFEANVHRDWGHEECECELDENGNCTCGGDCTDCHDDEPSEEGDPPEEPPAE